MALPCPSHPAVFLSDLFHYMSWIVWLGELKCAATGLSVLLSFTSERWLLIRSCSACSVSPTYYRPHLWHWITYTTLVDLHEADVFILWVFPVLWLVMESIVCSIGQVLHPRPPHGLVPGCFLSRGVTSTLTNKSRRFLGLRYAIRGGSGTAFRILSERWRM